MSSSIETYHHLLPSPSYFKPFGPRAGRTEGHPLIMLSSWCIGIDDSMPEQLQSDGQTCKYRAQFGQFVQIHLRPILNPRAELYHSPSLICGESPLPINDPETWVLILQICHGIIFCTMHDEPCSVVYNSRSYPSLPALLLYLKKGRRSEGSVVMVTVVIPPPNQSAGVIMSVCLMDRLTLQQWWWTYGTHTRVSTIGMQL